MQCEERISKLPGKPQRTDREHLMIARAVDVGQHEEVFMVQLRASHESPPNPVIAAVSAVEPDELQRVRTHLWVKTTELPFEIALVAGINPAHDRVTRRRCCGPGHAKTRGENSQNG